MKKHNFFANLPSTSAEEESFEEVLKTPNVVIERIVSEGHSSPATGWYEQKTDEWVMLLAGNAVLAFEAEEVLLQPNDYIFIPAGKKHKVLHTDKSQPTVWLAVHITK